MERTALRELRDAEAFGLALFAVVATYLLDHDWRLCIIAALGVLAVRVAAGVVLHGTHPPADEKYPGLTENETRVAWYIFRGRGNPAIARRTGLSLSRVGTLERSIKRKWGADSREAVARHVGQLVREAPPHRSASKQRGEWVGELAFGLGIIGVGLALLAVPPETVLIGGVRDWLGLSITAAGLVFVAVSTVTYLWERRHR